MTLGKGVGERNGDGAKVKVPITVKDGGEGIRDAHMWPDGSDVLPNKNPYSS